MLTQARLKELLTYDPETGAFYWVKPTSNRVKAGRFAGSDNGNGYIRVRLDGRKHFHHRLAWLWVYAEMPADKEIDHIDGNPSNNAIANLRAVSRSENEMNKSCRRDNALGVKGVYFCSLRKKFKAEIKVNGNKLCLGSFSTLAAAANARKQAEASIFGEFGRAA